ncbi:hypothetical protein GQR58_024765 [Nymphon striatum]|nr:hypothetical protein GQR58_024765 [Nymphon striatum]
MNHDQKPRWSYAKIFHTSFYNAYFSKKYLWNHVVRHINERILVNCQKSIILKWVSGKEVEMRLLFSSTCGAEVFAKHILENQYITIEKSLNFILKYLHTCQPSRFLWDSPVFFIHFSCISISIYASEVELGTLLLVSVSNPSQKLWFERWSYAKIFHISFSNAYFSKKYLWNHVVRHITERILVNCQKSIILKWYEAYKHCISSERPLFKKYGGISSILYTKYYGLSVRSSTLKCYGLSVRSSTLLFSRSNISRKVDFYLIYIFVQISRTIL